MSIKNIYGLAIELSSMVPAKGMLVTKTSNPSLALNDPNNQIAKLPKPIEFFTKFKIDRNDKEYRKKLYNFLKHGMIENKEKPTLSNITKPKLTLICSFNKDKQEDDKK